LINSESGHPLIIEAILFGIGGSLFFSRRLHISVVFVSCVFFVVHFSDFLLKFRTVPFGKDLSSHDETFSKEPGVESRLDHR